MRSLVCWLPAIVAFFLLFFRPTAKVFLQLYLPVLLLLPQQFFALTTGFPKLGFAETTIIPITISFFIRDSFRWKFTFTDVIIFFFIFWKFFSEYENADLHYAINKLATLLCDNVAPYILAKGLIHSKNLDIVFAKKIVYLMFVNVLVCFFEAVTGYNLHVNILSFLFFPGNYNIPLERYGFVRIVGPFADAILFGIGLAMAILLNYWLCKNKKWEKNFKYDRYRFIKKETLITSVLVMGLLLNLSRGPIISCFLGYLLIGAGFSRKPIFSFAMRTSVTIFIIFLLYLVYAPYADLSRDQTNQEEASNVTYRWDLISAYTPFISQKPWIGWGTYLPPMLNEFPSIDNEYLLMALTYGMVAVYIYVFLIFWMILRFLLRAIKIHRSNPLLSSLLMTLLCTIATAAFCFITVFMGFQTEVLFFLLIGWGDSLIAFKSKVPIDQKAKPQGILE